MSGALSLVRLDPSLWLVAGAAAAALAAAALAARGFNAPQRRLRRGLRIVAGRPRGRMLMALGGQRGIAFSFAAKRLAVAWDQGAWGLVYRFDEIAGVELLVDDQVAGFAYRGDLNRPPALPEAPPRRVALRLVFEDPAYPDFELPLFPRGEAARRSARAPDGKAQEALAEAADWFARLGALLARPAQSWWETPGRPDAAKLAAAPPPPAQRPAPKPAAKSRAAASHPTR